MSSVKMTRRGALLTVSGAALLAGAPASWATPSEKDNRFITNGGCRPNGVIRKVTTLADDGPGSLRSLVSGNDTPVIIVFEVGGEIRLEEDLAIRSSNLTLAGQTAPPPGITLTGASVRVRADDVALEHIAIRPGLAALPAERADGLTIGGGKRGVKRVRVRNVSVSWSKDELASLAHPTEGPVSITHSIFAEALKFAGHPKGDHSMALLVRDAPEGASIAGNLFVSNVHRNPVLGSDVTAEVKNNWIVNPRYNAVHFYLDTDTEKLHVRVINNVMTPGPDTTGATRAVSMPTELEIRMAGSTIEEVGNEIVAREAVLREGIESTGPALPADADIPLSEVPARVLRHAGAHPAWRTAVDQRIIDEMLAGRAAVVDRPPETVMLEETRRPFQGPADPFMQTALGNTRIELWLEEQHVAAGGVAGIHLG